ncbi:hypothetical protein MYA_1116 [Burkholderia sp. KJ006]|nr:hypothetical protein MYA_1116 [Burkholderia sp. KJ006]
MRRHTWAHVGMGAARRYAPARLGARLELDRSTHRHDPSLT